MPRRGGRQKKKKKSLEAFAAEVPAWQAILRGLEGEHAAVQRQLQMWVSTPAPGTPEADLMYRIAELACDHGIFFQHFVGQLQVAHRWVVQRVGSDGGGMATAAAPGRSDTP